MGVDHNNCSNHLCNLDFNVSNDSQFMYDPGRSIFDTEDGSACDDNNSGSSSSNDNMPYNANTYHSFNCDCDK